MFEQMKRTVRRLACQTLGLVEEERVHAARMELERVYTARLDSFVDEAEQLREEIARMQPQASDAVATECPRCHAPAGERCRDADGRALRRTHRERTATWREHMQRQAEEQTHATR